MLNALILVAAVTTATGAATPAPAPAASSAASVAASNATHTAVDTAPIAHRRKHRELPGSTYMKQANDDPEGMARIQAQLRQLRPQI